MSHGRSRTRHIGAHLRRRRSGGQVHHLLELGVAAPLLPLIGKITTEEELLGLAKYAPQLTAEVLLRLYDGLNPGEVL